MAKFSEDHKVQGAAEQESDERSKQPTEPIPVITPDDTPGVNPVYTPTERMVPLHPSNSEGDNDKNNRFSRVPWGDSGKKRPENQNGNKSITDNPIVLLILAAIICLIPTLVLAMIGSNAANSEKEQMTDEAKTVMVAHDPQEKGTYDIVNYFDTGSKEDRTYHIYYNDESENGTIEEKHIELNQSLVTFEASGKDNTVTFYETTFDAVASGTEESDEPVVVTENAKDPETSAVIHYDTDKREVETFGLVSLEKKGGSNATLTYTEAAGITNTLSIPPSLITVEDDGEGIVEHIWEYDENGQWVERWVIHSLS